MSAVALKSRLPQIIESIPGEMDKALGEAAERIAELAKTRAPTDSGALRDSIHAEQMSEGVWFVVADVEGDDGTPYAYIVEFIGNTGSGVGPHAFMWPAFEQIKPEIPGIARIVLGEL